jgi:hypothetical protein
MERQKLRRYYDEGKTVRQADMRKMQNNQKKRQSYDNLRESQAQTKTGIMEYGRCGY